MMWLYQTPLMPDVWVVCTCQEYLDLLDHMTAFPAHLEGLKVAMVAPRPMTLEVLLKSKSA